METLTIKTSKVNELIDITEIIKKTVASLNVENGICVIYCPHTTGAITINEAFDDTVKGDILFSMKKISPDYPDFRHLEGNSAAHVKTTLTGPSQTLIINKGKLMLGQWQGIYFCEYDGPRSREVYIEVISK